MNPYDEINAFTKNFEEDFVGYILNGIILSLEKHHAPSQRKESENS